MVARLINRRLTAAITYHDAIHGFRAGRRTGTATLEAKLLQQLTATREAVLFEVFLDLQKTDDALDRERALELLAAYGFGPRTLRFLWTYLDQMTMVARASGYFGCPFKGYQGVTQGNPLSPMIFNVVVDAVIIQWVTVVTPSEVGTVRIGLTTIDLAAYFYANNGLVASTQPERIQTEFDVLTSPFDQVGLHTNTAKMVGMVYQPCHASGGMS